MRLLSPDKTAPSISGTVLDDDAPVLARIYARALVNAARKHGDERTEAILDDLDAVLKEVLETQPRFAAVLSSPLVSVDQKDRILGRVFEGRIDQVLLNFLRIVSRKGRLDMIGEIARQTFDLWERMKQRQRVFVTSAVGLDDDQQNQLRHYLEQLTRSQIVLTPLIDPELIGGLVIRIGDKVYDISLKYQLERLRSRMIERKTHEIQSRRDHFSH